MATIRLTNTNLNETTHSSIGVPYTFIYAALDLMSRYHSAHQNQLEWNHPPSFPGKCFHHRETTQTKKCLRALTNGDWKHFYNLFLLKTTSPTNFDRCESEAVMVTSLVLVCPLLPYNWVITVTILPVRLNHPFLFFKAHRICKLLLLWSCH